ncbi:MAG: hypothetical protein CBB71_08555 [Rhodopirellula sp. TMED11]|nr:MAG: hypothetical protein CBB71_08555 [Rhodopirellula sp. TMED11]
MKIRVQEAVLCGSGAIGGGALVVPLLVAISERCGTGSDQNLSGDFQRFIRFEPARLSVLLLIH